MAVLVVAEVSNGALSPAVKNVVKAASQLGSEVAVLVAGKGVDEAAEAASRLEGVQNVLKADHAAYEHALAENLAPLIAELATEYSHILAPANTFGKDVMPCVAAKLDTQQISDIIEIVDEATFVRPIYAGNVLATVQSTDAIKVITVRPTSFDKVEEGGNASIEAIDKVHESGRSHFVGKEESASDRPDLTSADIVISGGRGLGGKEEFQVIYDFADAVGAAVGASRAAVDAGYISNDHQVGQTGKVVAPDLYIAAGISGAIQHLAGMKDSRVIVAINKDENAPIFEVADYGLVADLFEVLPELQSKLCK